MNRRANDGNSRKDLRKIGTRSFSTIEDCFPGKYMTLEVDEKNVNKREVILDEDHFQDLATKKLL